MKSVTRSLFVSILVTLGTRSALGQTRSSVPPAHTVIRAQRVLDVKTGQTLRDGAVVIAGDKIVSVGPASAVPPGSDTTVINLPTATVLPGLIDAHTHLTFNPSFGYEMLGISVPREALIGAHNARVTLEAGFTTVRNLGARAYRT
jgi:imidazolonepropionase-like amidohydrolase